MSVQLLPDDAPFTGPQRAWLNGFFAGLLGLENLTLGTGSATSASAVAVQEDEDFPWHDPALTLDERMRLAEGRPISQQIMAAMGQLDCGQCGYLCRSYAEAIASSADRDLGKCVPGGKATAKKLKQLVAEQQSSGLIIPIAQAVPVSEAGYSRDNPILATLVYSERLNQPEAEKRTRDVVLDLNGSGISYLPGDSLGVFPRNDPSEVSEILVHLSASGEELVIAPDGSRISAREALASHCHIGSVEEELLLLLTNYAADASQASRLKALAEDAVDYKPDVVDILRQSTSAKPGVFEFISVLPRLQPRLYSIASSPKLYPNQIHLTVVVVRYASELSHRMRKGVASTYFAGRLQLGQAIPVYVQRSHGFRLPDNGTTPIIMVGPGTGVAPFRAFLQERKITGASGKSWLFFGNQHQAYDFFYRAELEAYRREGVLTRLDTAFSRDQRQKIYVQHRMLENAAELWAWLEQGAHFYVCGDAKRMARDVDEVLKRIVADQGVMSADDAANYVAKLAKSQRYLRDVY